MNLPFEGVGGGCLSGNKSRGYLSRGVRGRGRCGYRPRSSAILGKRTEVPSARQPCYSSPDNPLSRSPFTNIFSNMEPASAEKAQLLRAQLNKSDGTTIVERQSKAETKCTFCNSEKHRSRDCDLFSKKTINSNITCFSCKNPGHYKKECPNNKNFNRSENSKWSSHIHPHNGPAARNPHHRASFVPMPVTSSLAKSSAQLRSHLDTSLGPHVREPLLQRPPSTTSAPDGLHNQRSDIASDVLFDQMQCKSTFKSGKRLGQEPVTKITAKFSYCRSDSDEYATDLSISSLDGKKDDGDDMSPTAKGSHKEVGLSADDEKVRSNYSIDVIMPTTIVGEEMVKKMDVDEELAVEAKTETECDEMPVQLMEVSETGRSDLKSESMLVLEQLLKKSFCLKAASPSESLLKGDELNDLKTKKHSDDEKKGDEFDKEGEKDTVENSLLVKPLAERVDLREKGVLSSPAAPTVTDEELKKIIEEVVKENDKTEKVDDDELSPKMIVDFDSESDSNELKNRVESDEDIYGYDGAAFVEEEGEEQNNLGERCRNSSTISLKENEPPTKIEVNVLEEGGGGEKK